MQTVTLTSHRLAWPPGLCVTLRRCRYAGCEPHNVAAFMGGVASQEVVKLITRQYVPLNNTYVYNAISSNGNQFEL